MNAKHLPPARPGRARRACLGIMLVMALGAFACAQQNQAARPNCPMPGYAAYNQGLTLLAEGQPAAAARDLTRALETEPYLYPAYYHLGLAYAQLQRNQDAAQVWSKGIDMARSGPDRPDYDRGRAVAEMTAALAGLQAGRVHQPASPVGAGTGAAPIGAPAPAARQAPAQRAGGSYAVLFSSNLKPASAAGDKAMLSKLGYSVTVKTHKVKGRTWHRVWVGCCTGKAQATRLKAQLAKRTGRKGLAVMKP